MAHPECIQMGFQVNQLNCIHQCLKILADLYLFPHTGSLNSAGVGEVCACQGQLCLLLRVPFPVG